MKNLSEDIDINGDNLFKILKQVCPHCNQVVCYINAEHIDNDYESSMIEHLKGELKRAQQIIMGYEAFCQEQSLSYGLIYELNKLKNKFNKREE